MSKSQGTTGFVLRKVLHVVIVGAFAYGAITYGRWPTLPIAAGCLGLALGGEWLRTRWGFFEQLVVSTLGALMTQEERRKRTSMRLNGATWSLIAVVLSLVIFPMPVASAALLVLAVGDPLAAIVGRTYGRFRVGKKSAEGTVAFFVSSLLAVMALTPVTLAVAAAGCGLAALVELIPFPGYDNIWIAAAAGGGMMLVIWLA